jgi:hypothetical protein
METRALGILLDPGDTKLSMGKRRGEARHRDFFRGCQRPFVPAGYEASVDGA